MRNIRQLNEELTKVLCEEDRDLATIVTEKDAEFRAVVKDCYTKLVDGLDFNNTTPANDAYTRFHGLTVNCISQFRTLYDYLNKKAKDSAENPEEAEKINTFYDNAIERNLVELDKCLDRLHECMTGI